MPLMLMPYVILIVARGVRYAIADAERGEAMSCHAFFFAAATLFARLLRYAAASFSPPPLLMRLRRATER